jgi:hypothetical protein
MCYRLAGWVAGWLSRSLQLVCRQWQQRVLD